MENKYTTSVAMQVSKEDFEEHLKFALEGKYHLVNELITREQLGKGYKCWLATDPEQGQLRAFTSLDGLDIDIVIETYDPRKFVEIALLTEGFQLPVIKKEKQILSWTLNVDIPYLKYNKHDTLIRREPGGKMWSGLGNQSIHEEILQHIATPNYGFEFKFSVGKVNLTDRDIEIVGLYYLTEMDNKQKQINNKNETTN